MHQQYLVMYAFAGPPHTYTHTPCVPACMCVLVCGKDCIGALDNEQMANSNDEEHQILLLPSATLPLEAGIGSPGTG